MRIHGVGLRGRLTTATHDCENGGALLSDVISRLETQRCALRQLAEAAETWESMCVRVFMGVGLCVCVYVCLCVCVCVSHPSRQLFAFSDILLSAGRRSVAGPES